MDEKKWRAMLYRAPAQFQLYMVTAPTKAKAVTHHWMHERPAGGLRARGPPYAIGGDELEETALGGGGEPEDTALAVEGESGGP